MGTLLVTLAAAPIAVRFGWRAVYLFSSAACLMFLFAWLALASSSPNSCKTLTTGEKDLLKKGGLLRDPGLSKMTTPKKFLNLGLFLHIPVWTVFICGFAQNCQVYFAEWLPLFYSKHLGVAPDVAGVFLAAAAAVELPARAMTKDMPAYLAKKQVTLLHSRKLMSLQGFGYHACICVVLLMMMSNQINSPILFTAAFALSRVAQAFHAGGYFANYLDLTQEHVGMLTGLGNTLASFAGIVVPTFVACSLEEMSNPWSRIVGAGLAINVVAACLVAFCMSVSCLDEKASTSCTDTCLDDVCSELDTVHRQLS